MKFPAFGHVLIISREVEKQIAHFANAYAMQYFRSLRTDTFEELDRRTEIKRVGWHCVIIPEVLLNRDAIGRLRFCFSPAFMLQSG
jgi:hypothetical protein